jgi:putative endonuclease
VELFAFIDIYNNIEVYYTYIIQSEQDGSYYIGYSKDPVKRLKKHNSSNTGYTSTKQPWEIVFLQSFPTKQEAIGYEKKLKRQKSKVLLKGLINSEENEWLNS